MPYRLPSDYVRRTETVQLDPHRRKPGDAVWQPDVLPRAAELARELGAPTIVDIGCGNGRRLAELAGEFRTIGIDASDVVDRIDLPGEWIGHDLGRRVHLPVDDEALDGAVMVCADVIEHIAHPERLRNAIASALDRAAVAVISTPDRDLVRGADHRGPCPNLAHAQEWTLEEFVGFLGEKMTVRSAGYTRQRDTSDRLHTIIVEATAR